MCGISGVIGTERSERAPRMRAMRELLVHRGPDSDGEFVDQRSALGIRRLRVIDLATGDQPLCNEERTVWTVFNGEIYNFKELRAELLARGHRLVTASDTEVIPHLYEDLGERFVERIDGMFALAVWDQRTGTLVLARDRLGKKPLLYRESEGEIAFASEHAALLAGTGPARVDLDAIRLYLQLGYVPAPRDAFRGVRKLPPAHVLVWRDGRATISRYWSLPTPGTLRITEAEAIVELRAHLERAVARRLVADVPVGAFLSGGVDSSAVVATMAKLAATVRTFTIVFGEAGFSEAAHARRIAERYGTQHHEFVVTPSALDVLPTLVRHYGEPYADSSAIPTYYLSRLTREHVTVALNGDGGDESFAGYDRYFAARLAASLDVMPAALRRRAFGVFARLLPDSLSPRSAPRRARRFLMAAALPPAERYARWMGLFHPAELDELLDDDFAKATEPSVRAFWDEWPGRDGGDPVVAAQLHDFAHYLPDDLLAKVDIASMANSLEVRSPFLDRELVEFAIRLPTSLKIRGTQRKYLLKRALAGIVPDENMYRPKQGFALPIGDWFRGELRGYVEDVVLDRHARARAYFRPEPLERYVRVHTSGRADHAAGLWALLWLELWHRELVDSSRPLVEATAS